jgi:TPR repeat protein
MHKAKYVLYFIASLLLISCDRETPIITSAPEDICKNTVLQTEEAGSNLIALNENLLGQANENKASKASTPIDQLKYISQLSEETVLQNKEAQGTIIQAIAQGWQNINQYVKEAYIPFILGHGEKEEPEALVALLWLMEKYTENSLLKSYKLKTDAYQQLLIKLEEPTGHNNIDGMHAYYIGKIYSSKAIQALSPNASKAIAYYEKAISMRNDNAAYALGYLYYDGIEGQLAPNAAKAIEYYEKAIRMGSTKAVHALGYLYHNGMKGQVAPNAAKAIEYYEKAISMKNAGAAYALGYLYHNGIEKQLAPNAVKAVEYYGKAISMGYAEAATNLGIVYHNGIEGQIEPSAAKAIAYYKKAISMGDAGAAHNLGIVYEQGIEGQLMPNAS